jgi:hypothetical protein
LETKGGGRILETMAPAVELGAVRVFTVGGAPEVNSRWDGDP